MQPSAIALESIGSPHDGRSLRVVRALLVLVIALVGMAAAQQASAATTFTLTSSQSFYREFDNKTPQPTCAYASFTVRSTTTVADGWVNIGSFTGSPSVMSLAAGEDGWVHVGQMAANTDYPVFFYLCASAPSTTPQTFTLTLSDGRGAGATTVGTSSLAFASAEDANNANANKVDTTTASTSFVGGNMIITVRGTTGGSIGATDVLSFTPTSNASWPAGIYELRSTSIAFGTGTSAACTPVYRLIDDLSTPNFPTTGLDLSAKCYVAEYTFAVNGVTTAAALPISYIASGQGNKYMTPTSLTVPPATNSMSAAKSASPSTLHDGGTTTYTVTFRNTANAEVTFDSIVDTLPTGATYTPGTAKLNGGAIADPAGTGTLTWTRPIGFTIPANGTITLTFDATIPMVAGTHTNSVVGMIGSTVIDTTPTNSTDNTPATAAVTVILTADVQVTKSLASSGPHLNGQPITFDLVVKNNGPNPASGVTVTDLLPVGTTYNPATGTTCTSSVVGMPARTFVSCPVGTLAVGASRTIPITLTPNAAGSYGNAASVTSTSADPVSSNDTSSTVPFTVVPAADLSLAKTVTDPVAGPYYNGDELSYSIKVTNTGPDAAQGVVITDTLPSTLTFVPTGSSSQCTAAGQVVTCNVGTVASGASATAVVRVRVLSPGASVTNTASVTSTTADPTATNNTASVTTSITRSADVRVAKTTTTPTANVQDTVTFTLTASNAGPDAASNVRISDTLPGGMVYVSSTTPTAGTFDPATMTWTLPTLAVGATPSMTITATVTGAGSLINRATAVADTHDPNTSNNTGQATITVPQADISVTKALLTQAPTVGSNATFRITVTNNSTTTAAVPVSIVDTLPTGLTYVSSTDGGTYTTADRSVRWSFASLAPNTSRSVDVTVRVDSYEERINSVTASTAVHDPNRANNTATASINAPDADLSVVKTVASASPEVGDTVTYTIAVTNHGSNDATNVVVTEALPTSGITVTGSSADAGTFTLATRRWEIPTLPVGATRTLTITATVTATTATNSVAVTSDVFDPITNNNTSRATFNAKQADLRVAKTVDNATPQVGDLVTYTINLYNAGPDAATSVVVQDLMPIDLAYVSHEIVLGGGTFTAPTGTTPAKWTIASLAKGTPATAPVATLTVTARVTTTAVAAAATQTNTAVVTSSTYDPVDDNRSSVSITPKQADLALAKTVSDATPNVGDTVTYTVALTNAGPDAAKDVVVEDILPAGVTYVAGSANATPGTATYSGGKLTWTVTDIAKGATGAQLTFRATIDSPSAITNTATIASSGTHDPTSGNNSAGVTVDAPQTDLLVTKVVDATASPAPYLNGQPITYVITAANSAGGDVAENVVIRDVLPAGAEFVSASGAACTTTTAAGVTTVSCPVGTITTGDTATVRVTMIPHATGATVNTGSVSSSTHDTTANNNTATTTVTVVPAADLTLSKRVSAPAAGPYYNGSRIQYALTVANAGPDTAKNVVISDTLPAGLTFAASPGCTAAGQVVTCAVGDIPANGSVTVNVNADVLTSAATVTNSASVTFDTADPDGDRTASVDTPITPSADIAVAKRASTASPNVGDEVTYTVTVTNAGPSAAQNVVVTDELPAGLTYVIGSASPATGFAYAAGKLTWTLPSVPAGATGVTLTFRATVTAAGSITNSATATTATHDSDTGNNSGSATVGAAQTDLSITKAVDTTVSPGPYLNGQPITYTLTATNSASGSPAQGVVITDVLPAGAEFVSASGATCSTSTTGGITTVSCPVGTLTVGGTATVRVTMRPHSTGELGNTATVTSATHDGDTSDNTATETVTVVPAADLSLSKSVSSPSAGPYYNGQEIEYSLVVANAGPDAAQSVSVTDTLPAGLTFVSSSTGCTAAGQTVTCTVGTIAANTSTTLKVGAKVLVADGVASVKNRASVTTTTADPDGSHPTATVTTPITPSAGVSITKTVDRPAPNVGDLVVFTITATNAGPNTAVDTVVTDVFSGAGMTFVSASTPTVGTFNAATRRWTIPSLANGTTATVTVTARITAPGVSTNTATITSAGTHDPDTSDDAQAVSVNAPQADLKVEKALVTTSPTYGGNATFRVTVTNLSTTTAATGVTVTDTLPIGLTHVSSSPSGSFDAATRKISWTGLTVPADSSTSFDVVVTVDSHEAQVNTATVSSSVYDPVATNNTATQAVDVPDADLEVQKSVSDTAPAIGSTVTYTITAINHGGNTASNVVVTDVMPASGITVVGTPTVSAGAYNQATGVWTLPSLAVGDAQKQTLTFQATVTGPEATNRATITSDLFDPITLNNEAQASFGGPVADLAIDKTVSDATPDVGQTITYTITVNNAGPADATSVTVQDLMPSDLAYVDHTVAGVTAPDTSTFTAPNLSTPASWTISKVPAGTTATLTVRATVTTASVAPLAKLTNTAVVRSATTTDPSQGNNSSTATVTPSQADIALAKTVNNGTPRVGDTVTFTLAASSPNGPATAENTVVTDVLPAGLTYVDGSLPTGASYDAPTRTITWTIGSLAKGATPSITFRAVVTTPEALTNTASITSTTHDPAAGDNTSSIGVDATQADVSIQKTAGPDAADGTVVFTIRVTNTGPDAATDVVVADTMPTGITLVSADRGTVTGDAWSWTIPNLAPGSVEAKLTTKVTTLDQVTNTATIESTSSSDPDTADHTSSVDVQRRQADVSVTKTASPSSAAPGQKVTYTVTITNAGTATQSATDVTFSDAINANLAVDPSSLTGDPVTLGGTDADGFGGTLVHSGTGIGPIAPGGSVVITYDATVRNPYPLTAGASIPNTVTVDPSNGPSATGSTSTTIATSSAPTVQKTSSPASVVPGQEVTYTVTVGNASTATQAATGITFSDAINANLKVVPSSLPASLTLTGADPDGYGGTITQSSTGFGTLAPGASVEVTYRATVRTPYPTTAGAIANTATVGATNGPSASSSTSTPINATSRVSVTKTATPASVTPGGRVTYTVRVANAVDATQAATGVTFNDVIDANLAVDPTSLAGDGIQLTGATGGYGGTLVHTGAGLGPIAPGDAITIVYEAVVRTPYPTTAGAIANTVTVDPANGSPATSSATSTTVAASSLVTVAKEATPASVAPGGTITYRVTISNDANASQAATNVTFSDAINANLAVDPTSLTGDGIQLTNASGGYGGTLVHTGAGLGPVAPGASLVIEYDATVRNPYPTSAGAIPNTATVKPSNGASATSTTTSTSVAAGPAVAVTKTADRTSVVPGDTITYTITATNTGNQDAIGVTVTDAVDPNLRVTAHTGLTLSDTLAGGFGGTLSASNVTIPAGGPAVTYTVTAVVKGPFPVGATAVENQVRLAPGAGSNLQGDVLSDADPAPGAQPISTPVTAAPIVAVTKTTTSTTLNPGDPITYVITATNTGNQDAAGVTVTDAVDANLRITSGGGLALTGQAADGFGGTLGATGVTIPAGGSRTYTVVARVRPVFPIGVDSVTNQVVLTAGTGSNLPGTVTSDAGAAPGNQPLETPVTAAPALSVTKTADRSALIPGQTITYTITVTNSGDRNAVGIAVNDVIDPNLKVTDGGGLALTGQAADGFGGTLAVAGVTVPVGSPVVYTVQAVVRSPFPLDATAISNAVSVRNGTGGNLPGNPTIWSDADPQTPGDQPVTTTVNAAPRLHLQKSATVVPALDVAPTGASPGDVLEYTLTLRNLGDRAATNVLIRDLAPDSTDLVAGSVTTSTGTPTEANNSFTVSVASLAPGDVVTVTFRVRILSPLAQTVKEIRNVAEVSADGIIPPVRSDDDANPDNGLGDTVTPLVGAPKFQFTKAATLTGDVNRNGVAEPGDTLTYRFVLKNVGPYSAPSIIVTDPLDRSLIYVPDSAAITFGTGTVTPSTSADGRQVLTFDFGTVEGGGSAEFEFQAKIAGNLPPLVTAIGNQATATSDGLPDTLSDDPTTPEPGDATSVSISAAPQITFTKTVRLLIDANGDGIPNEGDTLEWFMSVNNHGNMVAGSVTLTDRIDPNTTIGEGSVTTDVGTVMPGAGGGAGEAVVHIGDLDAGGQANVTIHAVIHTSVGGTRVITNQAVLTGSNFDPIKSDNPATPPIGDPTEIVTEVPVAGAEPGPIAPQPASLSALKAVDLAVDRDRDGRMGPGDTLRYTISVTNTGGSAANDVVISDPLPSQVTLAANGLASTRGTVRFTAPNTVNAAIGTLAPGQRADVTILVTVRPLARATTIRNQAMVSATGIAPFPTDSAASPGGAADVTTADVVAPVKVRLVKTGPARARAGSVVTYRIRVTNIDRRVASGVIVLDQLPAGMSVVRAGQGGKLQKGIVRWQLKPLAPGRSTTVTLRVRLTTTVAGNRTNVARVMGANFPAAKANAKIRITPAVRRPTPRVTG